MRGFLTKPIVLIILFLFLAGFVGGPIGASFLGMTQPTGLFGPPRPHISLAAEEIVSITRHPLDLLSFSITNTMLVASVMALILILVSWRATRRLSLVPRGVQNFMEAVVEIFLGLVEGVAGKGQGRRFLPLVATIFLFVAFSNLAGLLPGFATIGLVERGHEEVFRQVGLGGIKLFYVPFGAEEASGFIPFFRSANSDVNIPLALALITMFMAQVWGVRSLGLRSHLSRFISLRQLLRGRIFNGVMDLFTGLMEAVSQAAQIISLTFRLFGNIFAGEVLLLLVAFLFPVAWILPFFGLELIIGLVQAFIFAMLALVWATINTMEHSGEHRASGEATP